VQLNSQIASLPVAKHFVAINFDLQCTDTFLINDPLAAMISGFDHAPLITMLTTPGEAPGNPVLSGSSLRGALRSHAEKIARTLATEMAASEEEFLTIVPAGNPFATNSNEPLATWDRVNQKAVEDIEKRDGEVSIEALHLADRLFGNQLYGSRLWVRDAHMVGEVPVWQAQDFLAVDPFTGGGKDGAKFDAAPLVGTTFRGQIILYAPQKWELGWLALVFRDLAEGYVTLGFGQAKGYGQVKLQDVTWQVGCIHPDDIDFLAKIPAERVRAGVYETWDEATAVWLPDSWQKDAQGWLDAFIAKIKEGYSSPSWSPPENDSYFGTILEKLYPKATMEVADE
jgi:CRISPR/Cas system CSM-associated protein Csm3 (group 7 of RAMP superfamily)